MVELQVLLNSNFVLQIRWQQFCADDSDVSWNLYCDSSDWYTVVPKCTSRRPLPQSSPQNSNWVANQCELPHLNLRAPTGVYGRTPWRRRILEIEFPLTPLTITMLTPLTLMTLTPLTHMPLPLMTPTPLTLMTLTLTPLTPPTPLTPLTPRH